MGAKRNKIEIIARKRLCFVAVLAMFFVAAVFGGSVSAAASLTTGVVTDTNGIRWEYKLVDNPDNANEPQKMYVAFYDKPENLNRVTVPSLADFISLVPNASSSLDTYVLIDADEAGQDASYPDLTRRTATASTTTLDMENTSKIQILGVKPIIDPEVETELIFGENMVLGDQAVKYVTTTRCDMWYYSAVGKYRCATSSTNDVVHVLQRFMVSNWYEMSDEEWENYTPTLADVGLGNCYLVTDDIPSSEYYLSRCYQKLSSVNGKDDAKRFGQAFSGYKLKMQNFDVFNYVGWETFKDSTFNEANTTITIKGDGFKGGDIFENTNVKKAIIKTETIGDGVFRNCASLTDIQFDDSVTKVTNSAFSGTGVTSYDFSGTNIKTIGSWAFENTSNLTSVNFTGIERIQYEAFSGADIREIYLPKSINWLGAWIFKDNHNMKKATVAYDTLTKGTILAFETVLGYASGWSYEPQPYDTIEELTVLAPYSADEELSPTHISYTDYFVRDSPSSEDYEQQQVRNRCNNFWGAGAGIAYNDCWGYGQNAYWDQSNSLGDMLQFELDYANLDSKKNIIAPRYFNNMHGLKKITVGDGYEYIGAKAFVDYAHNESQATWGSKLSCGDNGCSGSSRNIDEINLPDSLRGVGMVAFESIWNTNIKLNIPENIEFIGYGAFRRVFNWSGDFDFPNLVAVGDFAFESTAVHNIVLHDKLRFMGVMVFADCPNVNDITFDLDVFNPDIYISWAKAGRNAHFSGNKFQLRDQFGKSAQNYYYKNDMERWGFATRKYTNVEGYIQSGGHYGTITFTEKNVSDITITNSFPIGYTTGDGGYNDFFAYIDADKIDLSKTGWKTLSWRMFDHTAVGEVLLPEKLETIPGGAFQGSYIEKELVLPDTVKVIGDKAFNFGQYACSYISKLIDIRNGSTSATCTDNDRIPFGWEYSTKITKLPAALEYVGYEAFYGDSNLTADLNSPNLKRVYIRAFMGTRLRDVYLPSGMQLLREATFANIPTLRDITIDFDLGALAPSSEPTWSEFNWPQSLVDYAGDNIYDLLKDPYTPSSGEQREGTSDITFYTIFNRTVDTGQNKSEDNKYGKLTFSENARTDISMVSSQGYFSNMEYDEVDLGATGWKQTVVRGNSYTGTGAFRNAKIRKLTLPAGLETMTRSAFEKAEITESITIPKTVKKIEPDVFLEAKLGGNVVFEDGSTPLEIELQGSQNDMFMRSTITGTVTIPNRLSNFDGQLFMDSKIGGIALGNGFDKIGRNMFLRAEIGGTVSIPSSVKTIDDNGFMEAKMDGLVLTDGIEKFGYCSFIRAEVGGNFSFPATVKEIGASAFMYSKIYTLDSFKEGLETVGAGAFIHTNFTDNLVIPSSVRSIGWSAFNAGEADVHYGTVTIKPDLTVANASNQRVHQLLWNTSIDKLIIDSSKLVAMDQGVEGPVSEYDNGEEFWNMDIKEVVLNNLPKITYAAFNKCNKLESVDMSRNTNIREIDDQAFMNDENLHIVKFSPDIANETIIIGDRAFANTGFTTIGKAGTDFNLYASHFNAAAGGAFSKMAKLKSVDVPDTFSNATIPEKTFYDSPKLEEASIAYRMKRIDNAAFANDNKLKRIFIWGDTAILDENLPGYEAPISGFGADGDEEEEEEIGPTIPEGTDIYAYSSWSAEPYAGSPSRENFEGTFYPLDEVLYLTSNKTHVQVNDDETDFDKDGLIVYGLRRDGVVLESDSWGEFDGNIYARSDKDLYFKKMAPAMVENPEFATVWDTPVPLNELSLKNENFADIDFAFVSDDQGVAGVREIDIIYTDAYTQGKPDTDVLPLGDGPEIIDIPKTLDNIAGYVGILSAAAAAGFGLVMISRKILRRR